MARRPKSRANFFTRQAFTPPHLPSLSLAARTMKSQKKATRDIRQFFSPASQSPKNNCQEPPPQESNRRLTLPLTSDTSNAHKPPLVASTKSNAINASTSPPTASQTSANSGASKRIISGGRDVVLNSDSETDSLPDLDFGPRFTSTKTSTTTAVPKRTLNDTNDDDGLRRPQKKGKSKNFDVLARTAIESIVLEQTILQHKADLDKPLEQSHTPRLIINEDVLAQAVNDDEDPEKAHRLLLAMQRTNAVDTDSIHHFFGDTSDPLTVPAAFPSDSLPEHRWTSSFRDSSTRDQAFLTGFAHQIFKMQELPEELASWMLDQICSVHHEALSSKYIEILMEHQEDLRDMLDPNRIDAIFRALGADTSKIDTRGKIARSPPQQTAKPPSLPHSLKTLARLFQKSSKWISSKSRSRVFHLLCHVCMDDRVQSDADLLRTIQDAIEAIVCRFASKEKLVSALHTVVPHLLSCVEDPVLQRDLVYALPAESPLTAYLQRHLALAFLLHPKPLDVSFSDARLPATIHHHLEKSPHFRIKKGTDFKDLTARLTLLDIAIGPGLLSVPYQPLISPPISQSGSSPIITPIPVSSEINNFNAEVDSLTQHVKMLGNSIMETSASVDLTVLDAKDSIERLSSRLEHAVRIGGKRVHNVFGSDDEDKQLKVTDIFRKVAKADNLKPSRGIFDDDEDNVDDASAQIHAEMLT